MRRAAAVTAELQVEAYRTVVPGKTRDVRRRPVPEEAHGASSATRTAGRPIRTPTSTRAPTAATRTRPTSVIQPGDFIQTDFGIKVHGRWVTDIQRFAYVLAPGETAAPKSALEKWEKGKRGSRVALAAMKPGRAGLRRRPRAARLDEGSGLAPDAVGDRASGRLLGARSRGRRSPAPRPTRRPSPRAARRLVPGQTFAFDGFFCWELDPQAKTTKGISVEEMAVVTEKGAEYLIPPQEDLILIGPSTRLRARREPARTS